MIKKETILSVFDKKLTLLQYLKEIKSAIENSIVESFSCEQIDTTHVKFALNFADGTKYETDEIEVPQGPQGEKGDTGATPNISVSVSAETLEPNESATASVEQGGTPAAPTIAIVFGIPKGEKGEAGESAKMYLHSIAFYYYQTQIYFHLYNDDLTPFTNATLAQFLKNNSLTLAPLSHIFIYSNSIAMITQLYSNDGISLKLNGSYFNSFTSKTNEIWNAPTISDLVIEL